MKKFILSCVTFFLFHTGFSQLNFNVSNLTGLHEQCVNPTTLQFGPDGKLYVANDIGRIFVYTISKTGSNSYAVTSTQVIYLVAQIPNHNDDGTPETHIYETRQVTGLLVTGTAANPVLYVSSSDPRVGGGGNSGDLNLDTNSGTISKLTWNGSSWEKVDIVRGLPRSEENHAVNGMQLDKQTNSLYIAVGGITNAGSPSNNFAFLTEYALSAAILKVNLNTINSLPVRGSGNNKYIYDIPTLNDPSRPDIANPDYNPSLTGSPQVIDQVDPFGGNDGKNQAKIIPGGPVSIYSPGYRNSYDLLILESAGKAGWMYTIDNGANDGWGGYPNNVGTASVNNDYDPLEPGSTSPSGNLGAINNLDNLHLVSKPGMTPIYGGHPNPIRANPGGAGLYYHNGTTGTFLATGSSQLPVDWPPVPLASANPIEGNFLMPGETDNALAIFPTSTNGMAEYTSTNYFNGQLTGDILSVDFAGKIWRVKLNSDGTQVVSKEIFASGFGDISLDITTQGNGEVFDGTIWACDYTGSKIFIFTPDENGSAQCSGDVNSTTLDDDGDGFKNADETANGTDPCNSVSVPEDFDNDKISDKKDSDDDNDGIPDVNDVFHKDAQNGQGSASAIAYPFLNSNPGTGLFGLGFTGLMSNGQTDPGQLYDLNDPALVMGGAVGLASFPAGAGTAVSNNQHYGFQFGYKVSSASPSFEVQSSMVGPFFDNLTSIQLNENHVQGIFIGTGDQNNYLMAAVSGATGGSQAGIRIRIENNGSVIKNTLYPVNSILQAQSIQLSLFVNPTTGKVTVKYNSSLNPTWQLLEADIQLTGSLLAKLQGPDAVALGLIASSGNSTPFSARYDFMNVLAPAPLVANPIPDMELLMNAPDKVLNLQSTFSDDEGAGNITLSVTGNSNTALVKSATISAKSLTLSLATGQTGVALIKVRATDSDGYWVEDEFEVDVVPPSPTSSIRINSGGPALSMGAWIADQYYTGGDTYAEYVPISGTMNDIMYQDERWGDFAYKVPVPNGKYIVKLHFVEIYWTSAGQRLFNVDVENGQGILTNYDIWGKAGGMNAAVYEEFKDVSVTDGFMDISFVSTSDNAKISGIEIIPVAGPTVSQAIPDQQVTVNTATKQVSLANVFTDDGGAANIVLSVSGNTNTALIKSAVISGTTLTLSITAGQSGFALIKIKATDADGLFAEDEFKITVVDNTAPPTVANALPDITVNMNSADKTIALANVFTDDKPVTGLTYSIVSNSNTALIDGATITGSSLKLSFAAAKTGSALIKIRATDEDGLSVDDEFKVTVIDPTPPPVKPTIANPLPDINLLMNAADKSISLASVFDDDQAVSNLKLTVTGNSNPTLIKSAVITGSTLKLSLSTGKTGYSLIRIRATDAGGLYVEDEFKVTVTAPPPPNTAPTVVHPISDRIIYVNSDNQLISLAQVFSDDKGVQNLNLLIASNSNTGVITTILNGTTLSLAPVQNQVGSAVIKVQATDGDGYKVIDEFKVDVLLNSILINSGGPEIQLEGRTWMADHFYDDGKDKSDRESIGNTYNDLLYQTYREGDFKYSIPVPNGTYTVKLHFAELKEKWVGKRVFNVYVEKLQGVLRKYDLVAKAGGAEKAVVETFANIKVTDGRLDLEFDHEYDDAVVGGIEIIPVSITGNKAPVLTKAIPDLWYYINSSDKEIDLSDHFSDDQGESGLKYEVKANSNPSLVELKLDKEKSKGPPHSKDDGDRNGNSELELDFAKNRTGTALIRLRATDLLGLYVEDNFKVDIGLINPEEPKIYRINAGGDTYFYGKEEWLSDRYHSGGNVYVAWWKIVNTQNQKMYQAIRHGKRFTYHIPLKNGKYNVVLHFMETGPDYAGGRIFNVDVEKGQGKLNNYDIVKKWKYKSWAVKENFNNISISDGYLDLEFNGVKDDAVLSGIEIFEINDNYRSRLATTEAFDAEAKDSTVLLNWLVGGEELPESVVIERSADGVVFESIADLAQTTDKAEKKVNSFTDRTPVQGTSHYRLKFVHSQGSVAYSDTRSVLINKRLYGLMVYPNPTNTGIVYAELARQPGKEQIRVRMVDISGKTVLNQPGVERTSNMLLKVKLPAGIAKGIYILEIESNGKLYHTRLAVQ